MRIVPEQNGPSQTALLDLICDSADQRAGCWIFQHAMAIHGAKASRRIAAAAKDRTKGLSRAQVDANRGRMIQDVWSVSGFPPDDLRRLQQILPASVSSYEAKRQKGNLRRLCEGRQALNDVARAAGFASKQALMIAVFAVREGDGAQIPEELTALRSLAQREH